MTKPTPPLTVFLEQLDAFNSHDLERFLRTYSTDAQIFSGHNEVLRGAENLRSHYSKRLALTAMTCEVRSVVAFGDRWVVAHEFVNDGATSVEVIATFEIVNGAIVTASLVLGPPAD